MKLLVEVKDELVKECDIDNFEYWCIKSSHEVLQVLAEPSKLEVCESRKDNACLRKWGADCSVRDRSWGFESDGKGLELGQGGGTYNHRLGWNVTRKRYIVKVELGKVTRR
jgi:hypothetical protein